MAIHWANHLGPMFDRGSHWPMGGGEYYRLSFTRVLQELHQGWTLYMGILCPCIFMVCVMFVRLQLSPGNVWLLFLDAGLIILNHHVIPTALFYQNIVSVGPVFQIVDATNVIVVVTRWYGGIHLGPDRFKHINNCARTILEAHGYIPEKVW